MTTLAPDGGGRGTRRCAVAGRFYPADPEETRAMAQELLDRALAEYPLPTDEDEARAYAPKAIIAPHAGWEYSGDLAALAWSRLAPLTGTVRRVVLLGPTHYVAVHGAALPSADAFDTPLGPLPIPVDAVIEETRGLQIPISIDRYTHVKEHALEVHAPFLRLVLGEVELVPFNVGGVDAEQIADLIDALWGGPDTAIAVSTDLSHYRPAPEATRIDAETIEWILSAEERIDHERACGAFPLAGLLCACRRRGLHPELLGVSHSGARTGDYSRVVGYAAFHIREVS
ncbi:AmmeMemoRadiSam system protein B [Actinomyces mediterranea]|uniref:AmmeMemoRadiSam system protein B n=1 Tax=Actinomyces mediterranea TaxID=1871028 RepID=UPI0009709741|nr:AmmeMemoRadiSam system protein B [Actinomyces mediterranea]